MSLDINVDIGEGFPFDEALLGIATSASVCCGVHAGSPELTEQTVGLCRQHGVRLGAHPGFPDREGMGRRLPSLGDAPEWFRSVREQTKVFISSYHPTYIKPHGALYNLLAGGSNAPVELVAFGVSYADFLANLGIPVMLLPVSPIAQRLDSLGLLIKEGFADRAYTEDGRLLSRTLPGAVLEDREAVINQVRLLATKVDSICIHGDTPDCLNLAHLVRQALGGDQ
ncbi:MAG TPA: LamB/YcsF family protein [Fimbriimonadaceae bacterium]|nr:LamB/YcsF family protein [Fimbriimonadaceae bacterium]